MRVQNSRAAVVDGEQPCIPDEDLAFRIRDRTCEASTRQLEHPA